MRVLVTLPDGVWEVIERELKGKLGDKRSEIIRNIVIAYLSEKGFIKPSRGEEAGRATAIAHRAKRGDVDY